MPHSIEFEVFSLSKPKDLLLIQKFVRRMKGADCKIVNGQISEKAANLGPYLSLPWKVEISSKDEKAQICNSFCGSSEDV